MPQQNSSENVILLKKTKKDGAIPDEIVGEVAASIKENKTVIMPVDNIYGLISTNKDAVQNNLTDPDVLITRLISNFKMLDELSNINKLQFDFLHRIWPGEIVVFLEDKVTKAPTPIRIPKSKFAHDIIASIDIPLYYCELYKQKNKLLFKKREILEAYQDKVDCILIIDEFCKDHTPPSLIDITKGDLDIIYSGRVSSEEIKSLYFLGNDDSEL